MYIEIKLQTSSVEKVFTSSRLLILTLTQSNSFTSLLDF